MSRVTAPLLQRGTIEPASRLFYWLVVHSVPSQFAHFPVLLSTREFRMARMCHFHVKGEL